MNCTKCGAPNDAQNRFCYACGNALEASEAYENPAAQTYTDAQMQANELASFNARTMIAAKEARTIDIRNMRPITRMAYNIVESEKGTLLSGAVSLIYGLCGLGLVATLIKIFETVSLLSQSFISSGTGSSISELISQSRGDNLQTLVWQVVLFVVLTAGFIILGKLNIRIGKVSRRKKRENLDSRL